MTRPTNFVLFMFCYLRIIEQLKWRVSAHQHQKMAGKVDVRL